MTDKRRTKIGFNRKIEYEWMEAAASFAAAGMKLSASHEGLHSLLGQTLSSSEKRGALEKTSTVLTQIWLDPSSRTAGLHGRAASLIQQVDSRDRLAIHWAMTVATYPFFVDIASCIGRFVALQGEVSGVQVAQRMIESWGDRTTLRPAIRCAFRTMVDWNVLTEVKRVGVYRAPDSRIAVNGLVAALLIEAVVLDAEGEAVPYRVAASNPALFPFELSTSIQNLSRYPWFLTSRQGLDTDYLEVCKKPDG